MRNVNACTTPRASFFCSTVSPAKCGEEEEDVKFPTSRFAGLIIAGALAAGGIAIAAAPASASDAYRTVASAAATQTVQATQSVQAATQAAQNSAVNAVQQAVQSLQQCLLTGVRKGCDDGLLANAFNAAKDTVVGADFYRFATDKLLNRFDGALVNTVQAALNKLTALYDWQVFDWTAFAPVGNDGWAADKLVAEYKPYIGFGTQQSLNSLTAAMVG